ncbi:unnamed protein product, partial [Ectocarpus sp. 12 AP-2014]
MICAHRIKYRPSPLVNNLDSLVTAAVSQADVFQHFTNDCCARCPEGAFVSNKCAGNQAPNHALFLCSKTCSYCTFFALCLVTLHLGWLCCNRMSPDSDES